MTTFADVDITSSLTLDQGVYLSISGGGINAAGSQSIPYYPIGNGSQITLSSELFQVSTSSANATSREFISSIGMNAQTGYSSNDSTRAQHDKVAQYVGVVGLAGCADIWAVNHIVNINTTNSINAQVNESDLNNLSGINYGDSIGGAGLGPQSVKVFAATGAGSYRITAGYLAAFSGAGSNRGFASASGCVQSGFEDDSAAQVAFRDCGSHIDSFNSVSALQSGAALCIGNGQDIQSLRNNGSRASLMKLDGNNNFLLGLGSSNVYINKPFIPLTDNSVVLGTPSNRFTALYAVNGTIQTSDARLKTQVKSIDPSIAKPFISSVDPKFFKWIIGGKKPIYGKDTHEVLTEVVEGTTTMRTGVDPETGTPLFSKVTTREPKYEMQEVDVIVGYEDVPGKRLHAGFLASEIKDAFEKAGLEDFGGYVKTEDGTEAIRPDQLIPILWAAVQGLNEENVLLNERLSIIESRL